MKSGGLNWAHNKSCDPESFSSLNKMDSGFLKGSPGVPDHTPKSISMKSKKRTVRRRQITPEPPQEEQVASQPEVEKPKPEELLFRWIDLHCKIESGEELHDDTLSPHPPGYKGDKTFWAEEDIREIVKQVQYDFVIVSTIMKAAYHGNFQNPYKVLEAVEYDGVIFDKLTDYFEKNSPKRWDLAFCELIAACEDSHMCREQCKWRENRYRARANFKEFAQGQISLTLHSDRLYAFFFDLFFGYGSAASFVLINAADIEGDDRAKLMQGLIEKGKEGIFPWDFEKYLPNNK